MNLLLNEIKNKHLGTVPFEKVTQFANFIFAITFIQWMSTLSSYLKEYEFIGWGITFILAIVYIILIEIFEDMDSLDDLYRSNMYGSQLSYNISGFFGVVIISLFIPISSFLDNIPKSFTSNVIAAITIWMVLLFLIIPSIHWHCANKENKRRG